MNKACRDAPELASSWKSNHGESCPTICAISHTHPLLYSCGSARIGESPLRARTGRWRALRWICVPGGVPRCSKPHRHSRWRLPTTRSRRSIFTGCRSRHSWRAMVRVDRANSDYLASFPGWFRHPYIVCLSRLVLHRRKLPITLKLALSAAD